MSAKVIYKGETLTTFEPGEVGILHLADQKLTEDLIIEETESEGGIVSLGRTVVFNKEGSDYAIHTVVEGNSVSEPVPPSKDGYTFVGWRTLLSGGELVTFPFVPTEDVTLYAQFLKALSAPEIQTYGELLIITDTSNAATNFEIYADGELIATIDK